MARYSKPISLERLESALRNAGYTSTQLTVRSGVESIEIVADGRAWAIDQAGNIDQILSGSGEQFDPPEEMVQTIRSFREG